MAAQMSALGNLQGTASCFPVMKQCVAKNPLEGEIEKILFWPDQGSVCCGYCIIVGLPLKCYTLYYK